MTWAQRDSWHCTVTKPGGVGESNVRQLQGAKASSCDGTQHEMQRACIKVKPAEMEKGGECGIQEVEKTRYAARLLVVKEHDILMDLEREESRGTLEYLYGATGWMTLGNSGWRRSDFKNYKKDAQPSWFAWVERLPEMWDFQC